MTTSVGKLLLILGTVAALVLLLSFIGYQNVLLAPSESVPVSSNPHVDVATDLLQLHYPRLVISLSKDLVVHSAYFDSRPRNGHSNVTILFVNVNKTILNNGWIVGCGAEGIMASNFTMYSIFENELMHKWFGPNYVIYENQLILCYNLLAKNGSSVFAVYKTSANSTLFFVAYSRQLLFYPAPPVSPRTGNVSVVVCSKAHNKKAPWFREFIQYQRTLGVDHIDFSVLNTFINDNGYEQLVLNDPVVLKALEEGYINFRVWPESYQKEGEAYFHSENLRKLACIYRYMGTYDYAMPMDTDDFFVPRSNEVKLKYYIKKYCYVLPAASCRVYWVHMYPECGMLRTANTDGNVTTLLKSKSMKNSYNYKSVHKTTAILDASFHDARCKNCMIPGTKLVHIPLTVAYVGHMRFSDNEKDREEVIKKICPH